MKGILLTLMISLLMVAAASAQERPRPEKAKVADKPAAGATDKPAAEALPTVDDVLGRFVRALGGKAAVEKQSSRVIRGTMELEAMNIGGTFEGWSKAPNKNALVIELSGVGTISNIYDGSRGWSADPMTGLRELTGAELAATARDSDFYSPLNFKKHFPKMQVKGKAKVGSAEAWVIEAVPAEGDAEKYYFDAASGLLIRQDMERESPQGRMPVEIYYDDYREVDGVKIAHSIKQTTPAFSAVIKVTEVKHDAEIDDAKFAKPAGQ